MEPETAALITKFGIEIGAVVITAAITVIVREIHHKKKYMSVVELLKVGLEITKDGKVTPEEVEEFIAKATEVVDMLGKEKQEG